MFLNQKPLPQKFLCAEVSSSHIRLGRARRCHRMKHGLPVICTLLTFFSPAARMITWDRNHELGGFGDKGSLGCCGDHPEHNLSWCSCMQRGFPKGCSILYNSPVSVYTTIRLLFTQLWTNLLAFLVGSSCKLRQRIQLCLVFPLLWACRRHCDILKCFVPCGTFSRTCFGGAFTGIGTVTSVAAPVGEFKMFELLHSVSVRWRDPSHKRLVVHPVSGFAPTLSSTLSGLG